MKKSYFGALFIFILVAVSIALLSSPEESTWIAMYLDSHRLKRAEELLWKHYQANPSDLDVAAKLVETLEALEDTARAKEIVQEVLRRNPENIQWKRRLAFILLAEKDPFAAVRVLPPHERDRSFWRGLAHSYHDVSRDDLAEEALLAKHEEDEDKAEVWRTLASWRSERNDIRGEKTALEQALAFSPNDGDLIASYFRNRAKAGDLRAALQAAEKLPKPLDREFLESLFELQRANRNYQAARDILEQLLARKDSTPADSLALVSILYLQNNLLQAQALLEELTARAHTFSPAVREALVSQSKAVQSALLLEAAKNGDEKTVLGRIADLRYPNSSSDPETLGNLVYACLRLSDFYGAIAENETVKHVSQDGLKNAKDRSLFWLDQAKTILDQNRDALPLAEIANVHLSADVAERRGDWAAMLDAWNTIARGTEPEIRSLLAIARATQHLHDFEASWQSLMAAEALIKDDADLLPLALQAQAVANALPARYPQRAEKRRHADILARKSLAKGWNKTLAFNLFFRALETKKPQEAEELLKALEARGLATPREYLALAETQLATVLRRGDNEKSGRRFIASSTPGTIRSNVVRNALKALEANDPETFPRILYLFTALGDKQEVPAILNRIKQARLPETPMMLRQMAEAYALLGDKQQQFSLLEKRARLSGQAADWMDAIDSLDWNTDKHNILRIIDQAMALHPWNAELVGRRILALADMDRYSQAIKDFQKARRREPEIEKQMSAESIAALGLAYDKNGNPDRARHFFKLSLEKKNANGRAIAGLANLLSREGKSGEAARLLRDSLERNPDNLWARVELANLLPAQKKSQYQAILSNEPTAAGYGEKAAIALAMRQTGRLRESLRLYSSLVNSPQRTPAIMNDYALALMDADKIGEAKKVLNSALREFPNHLPAHRLLAAIFIREKDYARAESCLRRALDIEPRNTDVSRELAYVQQQQNKFWSAQRSWFGAGKR